MPALAVCAVALGVASGARAQDAEPAAQITPRARVGPFTVSPGLAVRDLGVDSNVFNVDTQPTSDFTFTVVPAFVATAGRVNSGITLRSTTELVYFAEQASERSVNEDVSAAARYRLRRFFVNADVGYLNTRQRPTEEIDARSRRVVQQAQASVGLTIWPKLTAQLTGAYVANSFDADARFDGSWLALELNRTNRNIGGTVSYAATPLTTLLVTAETERSRFASASVRDSDSLRLLAGADFNPRALISGSVRVGTQQFRPLSADVPAFDGLIGSANVRYRIHGSTFGASFERGIDYSYIDEAPYYVRDGFGASVRRQLVSRWDVQVGAHSFRHHYRHFVAAVTPAGSVTRVSDEHFVDVGTGVGYQARPGVRVAFDVSYTTRDSEQALRRFAGFHAGATVAYGF